ncbi:MAG TPA: hypothetical protein VJS69_00785, partial [Candidatus Krumholzibacteria bacterium]|nr:hypothetical protein [Candidatus Krumholzibacteria bacterium]
MRRLFALIVLAVFAACAGDNGTAPTNNNPGGGGGGGGGAVTKEDSLRVQTLQVLATQLAAW